MARDLLKEMREAKTIQDGLIALVNDVRRSNSDQRRELDALRTQIESDSNVSQETRAALQRAIAANDEAAELADAMEAEGAAALAEGTDGFGPSQS